MIKFQTDTDYATGEEVLTCFLLPQIDNIEENGKGSINSDIVSPISNIFNIKNWMKFCEIKIGVN